MNGWMLMGSQHNEDLFSSQLDDISMIGAEERAGRRNHSEPPPPWPAPPAAGLGLGIDHSERALKGPF